MQFLLLLLLGVSLVSCDNLFSNGSDNQFTGARSSIENPEVDPTNKDITGIGDPDGPTGPTGPIDLTDPTDPIDPTNTNINAIGPNPLENFFSGLSKNSKLTCDHQNITTNVTGPRDSTDFSFSGEFCPQSYESMSIQIIVDQSGSMATADPYRLLQLGCGRKSAVNAIVQKIKRTIANQTDDQKADVEIGLITFDSNARDEISHTDIEDFEERINAKTLLFSSKIDLCKANINEGELSGFTNYEAALNLARQKVSSAKYTKKVVVFITDGVASVSTNYSPSYVLNEYNRIGFNGEGNFPSEIVNLFDLAHQDGKQAADSLRNAFSEDFSMFALYLNGDLRDATQLNAKEKIAEIVDGEENKDFFLVSQADALTDAALKIAFPTVPINTSTALFSVTNNSNTDSLSLAKPLTRTLADRYEFETQSKKLLPGVNLFKVEATDDRGNKHTGQITVNFEPTD